MEKDKVLVVDDNAENLGVISSYLEDSYELFLAFSGEGCLECLEEDQDFDAILLDIMMPGLDGIETCKIIRQNPNLDNIPIIFVTAKNEDENLEEGFDVGGNDFLTKPVNKKVLLARLASHLERSKQSKDNIKLRKQVDELLNDTPMLSSLEDYISNSDAIMEAADIVRWKLPITNFKIPKDDKSLEESIFSGDQGRLAIPICSVDDENVKDKIIDFLTMHLNESICESNIFYYEELNNAEGQANTWRKLKVLLKQVDEDGNGYISGIFRNVDDEKRAQIKSAEDMKALEESLEQLQKAQNQLVETEKQAALGRLVGGVAHEVNTPLGIAITYVSYLEEERAKLMTDYANGIFKRTSFEKFCNTMEEALSSASMNLNRAGELIRSFKNVAIDQNSDRKRKFELKEYSRQVIQSLYSKWKATPHNVVLDVKTDDPIEMDSYPGYIMQIFTNLIENSIIHAFDEDIKGVMTITIHDKGDDIFLIYEDNGLGMDSNTVKFIFDPFFTSNLGGGGSGLGCHIIYNLVTQALNGTIECDSSLGEGTKFNIVIPKVLQL